MPLNLLKRYNELLDLVSLTPSERAISLKSIFNRDISNNKHFKFRDKPIEPTPKDGEIPMQTLFRHLTTVMIDNQTRKREFDNDRAIRLHWIKYHIEGKGNTLVFSLKEPKGYRTYIYDKQEKYVIILEPLRKRKAYYLLTAYYVKGKDNKRNKFEKKYKRRLNDIL